MIHNDTKSSLDLPIYPLALNFAQIDGCNTVAPTHAQPSADAQRSRKRVLPQDTESDSDDGGTWPSTLDLVRPHRQPLRSDSFASDSRCLRDEGEAHITATV
jgi:hypothetical protein